MRNYVTWIGVAGFGLVAIYCLLVGNMEQAAIAGTSALALIGVKLAPESPPKDE